ncbi:MAG TPA: hypothetical protein VJU61_06925 [Polyangiaceae bacterium]|nr:hypothetical protein [Polyangiaceae bacterium]
MSRHSLLAMAALAALTLAVACNDDPEPEASVCTPLPTECPGEAPSYTNVVAPIITSSCSQCHNPNDHLAWPLDDPTDIADWADSMLLNLGACLMPPKDSDIVLSDADREALNAWLLCGAPVD